jgi:hypothetical protein
VDSAECVWRSWDAAILPADVRLLSTKSVLTVPPWPAEGKRWDRTGGSPTRLNAHHHDRLSLFLGDATNSTEIGAILLASMGLGIASQ